MSEKIIDRPELDDLGTYEFGWSDKSKAGDDAKRGISDEVVRDISGKKGRVRLDAPAQTQGLRAFPKEANAYLRGRPIRYRL